MWTNAFEWKINIKDFVVVKTIGRGSYGKVYVVVNKHTGTKFAMKVIRKSQLKRKDQVKKIQVEKKIMEKAIHPYIMSLKWYFEDDNKAWFIMDYMKSGDLMGLMSKLGKFKEEIASFIAAEIVLALGHLHSLNIVYRDLKPQNVMIADDGHIRLIDFGLSKSNFNPRFRNTAWGTIKYLAPEIASDQMYDQSIDWWSLGIVIFRMLTNELPFPWQQNQDILTYLRTNNVVIPSGEFTPEAEDLLKQLLAKDPEKRLGHNGVDEIKSHPFFSHIDWKKLSQKEVESPIELHLLK